MARWATIETKGGTQIALSDADVLWAARMAAFEGGDAADTLWAVTQRAALQRRGLTAAIRSFSQPVNPLWLERGACCCGRGTCPAGQSFCGDGKHCTAARMRNRELAQSIGWDALRRRDPDAVRKTMLWAQAKLSNPVPKAVNFAPPDQARRFVSRNPDSKIVKCASNCYIAESSSRTWPKNFVTMRLDNRVAGESVFGAGAVVLVGGLGVLGFALLRSRGLV